MSVYSEKSKLVRRRWAFRYLTSAVEVYEVARTLIGVGVDRARVDDDPPEVSVTCSPQVVDQLDVEAASHGGRKLDPWKGRS